eukprot:9100442-Pyramimonas_sp.AAC.1
MDRRLCTWWIQILAARGYAPETTFRRRPILSDFALHYFPGHRLRRFVARRFYSLDDELLQVTERGGRLYF